jgi:hypothetical protein
MMRQYSIKSFMINRIFVVFIDTFLIILTLIEIEIILTEQPQREKGNEITLFMAFVKSTTKIIKISIFLARNRVKVIRFQKDF